MASGTLQHRITKSNDLIEASYRLSLNEQRLLLACIAQLDPRKPMPRRRLKVTADDFGATFGLPPHKAYECLEQAVDRLYDRDLKTNDGKTRERYRWVDHAKYHDGEGYVSVSFTQWVAPYLTMLNRRFTSYQLQSVAGMRSVYGYRIYEMLVQYRSAGDRRLTIEEFRDRLELDGKYDRFSNMKARVLDPAVKEINKKTDLVVDWKAERQGRVVTAIRFTFVHKPQQELDFGEAPPMAAGA